MWAGQEGLWCYTLSGMAGMSYCTCWCTAQPVCSAAGEQDPRENTVCGLWSSTPCSGGAFSFPTLPKSTGCCWLQKSDAALQQGSQLEVTSRSARAALFCASTDCFRYKWEKSTGGSGSDGHVHLLEACTVPSPQPLLCAELEKEQRAEDADVLENRGELAVVGMKATCV